MLLMYICALASAVVGLFSQNIYMSLMGIVMVLGGIGFVLDKGK